MAKRYFTSESVTEGHPDKIADVISDAILDEIMKHDPSGRVACEVTVTTGLVLVVGEISTETYVDIDVYKRQGLFRTGSINGRLKVAVASSKICAISFLCCAFRCRCLPRK